MNKILILGSNSTGGSYATYYFAKREYEVLATSRSEEACTNQLPYKFKNCPTIKFKRFSLNITVEEQLNFLNDNKPDIIINFASQSMVAQSWLKPIDWMQTNVVGQTSLLEAIRLYGKLKKYIHFSTPEVYGNTDDWVNESTSFNPSTPYASSRAFGDTNTKIWSKSYDIPVLITRAANIYCEGQHLYRIIPRTILAALNPNPLTIDGNGASVRSFIHMEDVCTLLELALSKDKIYDEFHISPRQTIIIRDLVKLIFDMNGVSMDDKKHISYGPERKGKDQSYLLDSSKAENELGWKPKITIQEGVEKVLHWYKNNEPNDMPLKYIHKA